MKSRMLRVVTRKVVRSPARVLQLSVLVSLVSIVLAVGASATTLVVGNCKSGGYPTIQQAINAAPVGATVQVCPGLYKEQVTITQSVTLQGIPAHNGDIVVISLPSGGLVANATDLFADPVAAQVLVTGSTGPVNISNLNVDASQNNVPAGVLVAGIYYQNSPGTINGVITSNQSGNQLGIGIFLEGGTSSPSVTVQNSYVAGFDYAGIDFETVNHPNTALTAKITDNYVALQALTNFTAGIQFGSGVTATVSGNSVEGPGPNQSTEGIVIAPGPAGSVSGNTVTGTFFGIDHRADGVLVSSNKLLSNSTGITLQTSIGGAKSNVIMKSDFDAGIGISFLCNSNPNVLSNTINFASGTALASVPTGLSTSTNKVFNTVTVRSGGVLLKQRTPAFRFVPDSRDL